MPTVAPDFHPGTIVGGPVFPEPVEVLVVQPVGPNPINRQILRLAELVNRREAGVSVPGLEGNIKEAEGNLTAPEYKTAARMRADDWLHVVYDCVTIPRLHVVHDPARLEWKLMLAAAHDQVGAPTILAQDEGPQ